MWAQLTSWFRLPAGRLGKLLADYPAFHIPFPGKGDGITDSQVQANLEALLLQRPRRLKIIGQLLREFGIDTATAFGEDIPLSFFDALDAWSDAHFPTIPDAKELADHWRWEASDYSGAEIAYSFLGDVAILLGEIMIHLRPGLVWRIDSFTRNHDGNQACRCPVIHGLAVPDNPTCPSDTHVHQYVFGTFKSLVLFRVNPPGILTRSIRKRLGSYPMLPGRPDCR